MVDVKHISYNFGSHWALKNVTFSLEKGDFLFLSGPSGAGKTTLLRLLYRDVPLARGAARVAGFDLRSMRASDVPSLRRQVSVVFQDFKVVPHRTVYENVAVALEVRGMQRMHIGRRVRAVLRSLGLEGREEMRCAELSGGEQQRVAIARSIVVNPQLLLADEPTGNLDSDLAMRLMDVFRQFHTFGTTVILATHNKEVLASMPDAKVLRLEDGQVTDCNWPDAELSVPRPAANALVDEAQNPGNAPASTPQAQPQPGKEWP